MDERDTVAVVLLLVFICWLLAIIIGMKVVNSWAQKIADARAAEDAERAERAEAVTATVTAAESEVD